MRVDFESEMGKLIHRDNSSKSFTNHTASRTTSSIMLPLPPSPSISKTRNSTLAPYPSRGASLTKSLFKA